MSDFTRKLLAQRQHCFCYFLQGCNFCSQVQVRVCLTICTEAGVGITIRSQTLSVPMSIPGVCAQWHSKFSNILVVCADRWTRIGFKSVTNYTVRPAFFGSVFQKGKKKAQRCFTLSVSCSVTGLRSAQSVRMTKLKHSEGGKKKKHFSTTRRLSQESVTTDAKIFMCNHSFKV